MKLAIFTLVEHIEYKGKYYGYAPYIREMDLWNAHFDEIIVVAPLAKEKSIDPITIPYKHSKIKFVSVPVFNVKSLVSIFKLLFQIPKIVFKMASVMRTADHLHFRSPSNVAALAAMVQLFFPSKKKTMRYTGNWDPKSNQPIGYRFQKCMFSNTFLSRNMTALVYGSWPNQSKNVYSFFTATYHEAERVIFSKRDFSTKLRFVFAGSLVTGKRPLFTVQIIEALQKKGIDCRLDVFGEGILKPSLEAYIEENNLSESVNLLGNQNRDVVKSTLQVSHFVILPSKSEGWPKTIAEGMFFGCIPISTKISCLDWMLDYGSRGILIEPELEIASQRIFDTIKNKDLNKKAKLAQSWSQNYTVERQAKEISEILAL